MGLSNARRALVVDSNPWNRRQICDVLADKGYEVSACESLNEGRKFYRSHPIVVAGDAEGENAGELEAFVAFVRESAGEGGGYVIRVAADIKQAMESSTSLGVDDVIAPPLEREVLQVKFEKADEWLGQRIGAVNPEAEVEVITSEPASPKNKSKTQVSSDPVKSEIEIKQEKSASRATSAVMASQDEVPPPAGEMTAEEVPAASVSIRKGNAVRRDASAEVQKSKRETPVPEKTTKYQYNLLIENAPLAMAMFDREMRYLIANTSWRNRFDLEEMQVIGRGHFDIFSEVSDRWQLLCDRAHREGREVVGEEFVEWPDGATDWVRWTMCPWEDKSGEPAGLVVSCGVITEEKAARGDQQFESGLAESLMSSGVTPLVVLDFNGRVVRCNRIAKRWGDWGEASGDDRYFWDAFVPPTERQSVHEAFHGHASSMLEDGEFKFPPVSVEAVRGEDGGGRLVAWTNTPRLGTDGVITGLVRVGVEIRDEDLPTATGELDEETAGELQDEWMDSFPLMCWRTNSRGKVKFFNRQWLDFRGHNALEECDNGWMDGLHEEDYDSLIHAFDTAAKTGARVNHVARIIGGDGQYRWLRFISARDFSDLEGASDGLIGYCEDLGRTIRLESELSAAKSRYDELLEDSTGAFRAKRSLEETMKTLEEKLVSETARLTEERDTAIAQLTEKLAKFEAERDQALEKISRDNDAQMAAALKESGEQMAAALKESGGRAARALEDKEVELGKLLEEKQTELAERESALAGGLKTAEAELGRVRETSRKEIETLQSELGRRVVELEKARDHQAQQHVQGLAGLETDLSTVRGEFDAAVAEKARLAAELEGEKKVQINHEAQLVRLRKEVDVAQKESASAATERDRFVTIPENAPFGMVLVGRDGTVLYANPATDKVAGVEFGKFDKVEDWLAQQGPADDEEGQEKLLTLWREGIWRKDGSKVLSMQTGAGLRELELKSKLLSDGQLLLSMFDVTDSQRAEEALRASEVKFRSIFYDSGVGMALVDRTGNIFDANPAQEKLMGFTRAELRKMHIEDCLSLEEIARTQELAKQMGEERSRSGELTIRLQPKDKRPAWAHMNVSLVRDPDGKVIFAAYFFHDITKEREAISNEQEASSNLADTRAEKQAIVEASPDLIVVVGPDGMVENVVPPVRFPLHVDQAMQGRPLSEVIPPIADDFARLAASSAATGGVETKEFSVEQGDDVSHFECRIARSGKANTVIVVRDVTVAKKAEEAMRRQALTFANLREAIIVADLKGRIKDWNPAAQKMFGYTREEAVGKGLYALYDRDNPKRFKQTISTAIGKHRKWEGRTSFHRKDGSEGECDVTYTPLLDEGGRPLALVGISRPAMPPPAPATAPASTGVGPQAGQASFHQLGQSLKSISDILAAQEASTALDDGARAELANNRARVRAQSLLHEVVEAGGDFEVVDFGQYVRELVQYGLAEFGPADAGIEVHLNVKGIMLPVAVAQPLGVILFELLNNSLRHAFVRRDRGMVGVSMGIGEEAGWLVVNDDGPGLPQDFDLEKSPHGVGLKIAAEQARQINGDLRIMDGEDTEIQVGFRLNGAT